MSHGAFALLERSLRVDSRAWSTNLTRLGLMLAIYTSLCFALTTGFMFGAPGHRFFSGIVYLDVTFMTLLGVSYFSTSITEEKEEDTLGLMLMAGISPLGILLGKSGGRLWQSLLLVAIQYPFVQLAVTMGGVMANQIWCTTIALLAYMIFLAGFGLLCSTLAPRSQKAVAWMVVGMILYYFVPMMAKGIASDHAAWLLNQGPGQPSTSMGWMLLGALGDTCILLELNQILATSFGESAWSTQVISNVILGVICAGLSWLLFGRATRNPSTESTSRGLVTRNRALSPFFAGRAWNNSFIWKDFHFVSGGTGMLLMRAAFYGGWGNFALYLEQNYHPDGDGWSAMMVMLMWLFVTFDAARVVSRIHHDEVRGQTLASLIMLPHSPADIVYSKTAGALLGWLPAPVISLLVTLISPQMRDGLGNILDENYGILILMMLILYFALVPHFAALLALYVRWGAVALAIGLTIGVYFAMMMLVMLMSLVVPSFFGNSAELMMGGGSFVFFCLCLACHIGVLLRVQALAAK